ncbi:MAG: hypothetical protein ACREH8_20030, partial [Opitutaceae bacterium]
PVAVHHATGDTTFDFTGDRHVPIFAQQPRADSVEALHAEVLAAVRHVDGKAIVHMAENWNHRSNDLALKGDHAACVAHGDRAGVRQRNWAVVMAGATCQVIGPWEGSSGDKPATPGMLADMRSLIRFFSAVPLHELAPQDELAFGDACWVLASEDGAKTVAYALAGQGKLEIRVASGRYVARWLDCATGEGVEIPATAPRGTLALPRPAGIGAECAVYLERQR